MKILVVNSLDYRYGTTYRTRMFADSFQGMGLIVKYVESNYKNKAQNIISVRQSDNIKGYILGSIKRFHICLTESYDLLFLQNFTPLTLPCLIAAKLKMRPIIVDWDAFEFMFQKTMFRKVLTYIIEFICPFFVKYITSPSTYLINNVKKRGIRNISKVPHFIDTATFDPNKFKSNKVKAEMLWNDRIIICYLCAFNTGGIRDLDIILKTFKMVAENNRRAFLLLIGEGILENKVLELMREYGINNYYIMGIKSQDKVAEYLNAADICLIFLQNDIGSIMRTSIKLLMYLSMNKVVIGYTVGESKDLFSGYIVSCKADIESFANKIVEVIDKKIFVIQNRNYIAENYDSKIMSKYLNDILLGLDIK